MSQGRTKDWSLYARHILDTIGKLERIRARGDIRRDEVLFDAALRNLQTSSEATQRLPDDIKTQYPDIPWRQISGFRNILVHNYLGDIDPQTVQSVIEDHFSAAGSGHLQHARRQR
ncbi:HepT-like ribonuclease domain-containing protein [Halotalea alkalilenta]|uniref:HepT-like ribonuclease domain-containing protein n=1 Tax=Halotalea alkalilenta TaxID=376489 RepID=UPI0007D06B8A|nr:HepT-like ribonuclease domain-containing protein [Halotalea alkalilenta]